VIPSSSKAELPTGGVSTITAQGTEANHITYKGDGWGTSKAVIDGSDPFNATWTRCTSAADCGGNPNWANIWYTTAPENFNLFCPVYEDGEFLWFAQDPNPTDPIFYDRHQDLREIPLNDPDLAITRTTLKDPRFLTQDDASFWNGSYVLLWHNPNTVTPLPVTSFDPQTDTLTFDDENLGSDLLYTDRSSKYGIVGQASLIDIPGEFGLFGGKIFFWPRNSNDPINHHYSISSRKVGIDLHGCKYVTIEGFSIRGFHGLIGEWTSGMAIQSFANTTSNVNIRNNEISYMRSLARNGVIFTSINCASNFRIENNYIHHCQKNVGIFCCGDRIYVDNNRVEYVGYHGIWFMYATNSRMTGNLVEHTNATHANGISIFEKSKNILVARNRVIVGKENFPYTLQNSENVYTIGNLFDGMGESRPFNDLTWSVGMAGTNYCLNNTIVRAESNIGAIIYQSARYICVSK
jgi:hypothetical protein